VSLARKTIDIVIFRLDRPEVIRALEGAVARGVVVRALIAHTNHGGEKSLRKLELRLLDAGVTVARTDDELVRYHGKMMVIDGRQLHVFGFNCTRTDMDKTRSFGAVTRNARLVQEALKLFEADQARQPYTAGNNRLIVSPENARERLAAFISGAKRQLLIYDPKVTDNVMARLLTERANTGVDVRVIGKSDAKGKVLSEKYPGKRLHVRAIIRDGQRAFIGSQSLRRVELDRRREIGIIVQQPRVVQQMAAVFEADWVLTPTGRKQARKAAKAEKKGGKEPGRSLAASRRRP
jgi:phosphatidylserine/phosphatidylglycerophosphate/cardiolipin synthase-like enzyme